MWNWLVSGLASGATLLLYDGSPFHPDGNILWDYAQAEKLHASSARPPSTSTRIEEGRAWRRRRSHDLSSLRTILSTGSPLAPDSFDYVYDAVKQRRAPGLDLGRHRHLRLLRARRSHQAGLARRDPGPALGHGRRCLRRKRAAASRAARASSSAPSHSPPCRSASGTTPTAEVPRRLLLPLPRHLAPRRLRRDGPSTAA